MKTCKNPNHKDNYGLSRSWYLLRYGQMNKSLHIRIFQWNLDKMNKIWFCIYPACKVVRLDCVRIYSNRHHGIILFWCISKGYLTKSCLIVFDLCYCDNMDSAYGYGVLTKCILEIWNYSNLNAWLRAYYIWWLGLS